MFRIKFSMYCISLCSFAALPLKTPFTSFTNGQHFRLFDLHNDDARNAVSHNQTQTTVSTTAITVVAPNYLFAKPVRCVFLSDP